MQETPRFRPEPAGKCQEFDARIRLPVLTGFCRFRAEPDKFCYRIRSPEYYFHEISRIVQNRPCPGRIVRSGSPSGEVSSPLYMHIPRTHTHISRSRYSFSRSDKLIHLQFLGYVTLLESKQRNPEQINLINRNKISIVCILK